MDETARSTPPEERYTRNSWQGSHSWCLDVGGSAIAEAAGFEAVLAGLRECAPDDDALLDAASPVLDALYRRFSVVGTRCPSVSE